MKKQLLLGSALLAAIGGFAQNARVKPSGVTKAIDKIAEKYIDTETTSNSQAALTGPSQALSKGSESTLTTPSGNWVAISNSRNIYGVLVSGSKPLQYNSQVNAVSFIHRCSATYTAIPANNSGAIVAQISADWGANWDSTCVWSDATNFGRYPQGGIYAGSPGNTNLSNAYVVATGPVTGGSGWLGSFYGSKQLGAGNYNATASSAPNAMQFFPNSSATGTVLGHDHSRYSFSTTGDGKVRGLAALTNDPSGTGALPGDTAALLMTGSFNGGVFTWSADKFQPNFVKASDGSSQYIGQPYMAWDSAGVTGYVVLIGAKQGATLSNQGLQPIVYKTTNGGASWTQINSIDFNDPSMAEAKRSIASISTNTALEIPFFWTSEGIDVTVDANGKLHIVSTIIGTASEHPDSLGFIFSFDNADGEKYRWPHVPGARPYIFDFTGDGSSAWSLRTIDSLSSEVPSISSSGNGYNDNPWDADPNNNGQKVSSSSRLQLSRTPNGKFIVYTWAESDTNFTNQQHKWNSIPDIKARVLEVATGSLTPEINISKLGTFNPMVTTRSMFHYVSPVCGVLNSNQITIPFTVSNSQPYGQTGPNTHWYISAKLDATTVGIKENESDNLTNSSLYPNPANESTTLSVSLKKTAKINITVYNMIGQGIKTISTEGETGINTININTNDLASGIYMVNVKSGNSSHTKKLIVE